MLLVGVVMERGLIKHFYKRPHADQILVTFGLAIVLQEIIKHYFGANPIPQAAPAAVAGSADIGAWLGLGDGLVYPWWRLVYFLFSAAVIAAVFAFLQFTTYGMVVRAGMRDSETVGLLGINIQQRFTVVFGIAAVVAGLAGVMYTPILPPDYHMGMDFLVLSFVVVRRRRHGLAAGRRAGGLPARCAPVLRFDEHRHDHFPGHQPDHHLPGRGCCSFDHATRTAWPRRRDGGLDR